MGERFLLMALVKVAAALFVSAAFGDESVTIKGPTVVQSGSTALFVTTGTGDKVRWTVVNPPLPGDSTVIDLQDRAGNDVIAVTMTKPGTYYLNVNAVGKDPKAEHWTVTHEFTVRGSGPDPNPPPVVVDPVQPPVVDPVNPPAPPKPTPVVPPGTKLTVTVFEEVDERTPAIAAINTSEDLKQFIVGKGYKFHWFDDDAKLGDKPIIEALNFVPFIQKTGLPCVVIQQSSDGKVVKSAKLPATVDDFKKLVSEVGG